MPHFRIGRGGSGLDVEALDLGEVVKTPEEIAVEYLAEKKRVREEEVATRVITKEDTQSSVTHLKCAHCDYLAKSPQGLTSHLRNKHRDVIVADSKQPD